MVIKKCLNNEKFKCSNGKQIRDFIYVDDVVSLIKKSLLKDELKGIYNIGSGKPITVRKVISTIVKINGAGKPIYGSIKLRKDEPIKLYPNMKKTCKNFQWKAKTDIYSGLKKTIKFYK